VSRRWSLAVLGLPVTLALLAAACSSSSNDSGSSGSSGGGGAVKTVDVTLSDDGCDPRSIPVEAGPVTFKVTNDNTAAVTEFEVLDGSRILGEVENVIPGADRSFTVTLAEGTYTTNCPGGSKFEHGTVQVADAGHGASTASAARRAAVHHYVDYVQGQADELVTRTTAFAAAVKAGDLEQAQRLFAGARAPYESIEPIAESFGNLDPAIDARAGDVPSSQWGGFHRIEKALFADQTTDGMGPVADKLVAHVKRLQHLVGTVNLEPAQIANGAVDLMNEVSTSKITGEEDRYSHTDLSDFEANLEGSKAAYEALRPLLSGSQASLGHDLNRRFADVHRALALYDGDDPVGNGFVLYTDLTPQDTRALSSSVDALAEPLSRVAAIVVVT
jgi:iron uptake system component EfeO